ncbi:hypothetical protein [Orrella marina]|uniref:Uncharacterized protein n=1 Tax=Orrella marina TaxID=2163011 RepID=A0A2R4XHV8_9BURK|nr:hypothetical protein [Orrella marina]AWB33380.1 hypothetical protein DBV39_06310 [Orrella marina]
MKQDDLIKAKNPDLRGSLAAMQRAAQSARDIAIQTNTAIIVVRNGQRIRITAAELRKERERNAPGALDN